MSHKGRSVASIGAAILVLMLAFDPLFQQILSYPTESVNADDHLTKYIVLGKLSCVLTLE